MRAKDGVQGVACKMKRLAFEFAADGKRDAYACAHLVFGAPLSKAGGATFQGYMFGKGVYFADMSSKSANYCFASRDNREGVMLLSEVALGDMHELLHANERLPEVCRGTETCLHVLFFCRWQHTACVI